MKVAAQVVLGNLSPQIIESEADKGASLLPTRVTRKSPVWFTRCNPLETPQTECSVPFVLQPWNFQSRVRVVEDHKVAERRERQRTQSGVERNGEKGAPPGLEWGAWLEFTDKQEGIRPSMLAFVSDCYRGIPELLTAVERKGIEHRWEMFYIGRTKEKVC